MEYIELPKFAKWFHQDFGVLFKNTDEGVNEYFQGLDKQRKEKLSIEARTFLASYPGKHHHSLKKPWLRLGAQWWNKKEMPAILKSLSQENS